MLRIIYGPSAGAFGLTIDAHFFRIPKIQLAQLTLGTFTIIHPTCLVIINLFTFLEIAKSSNPLILILRPL